MRIFTRNTFWIWGVRVPKPSRRGNSIDERFGSKVLPVQLRLLVHLFDYRLLPLEDLRQQLLHRRHLPAPYGYKWFIDHKINLWLQWLAIEIVIRCEKFAERVCECVRPLNEGSSAVGDFKFFGSAVTFDLLGLVLILMGYCGTLWAHI